LTLLLNIQLVYQLPKNTLQRAVGTQETLWIMRKLLTRNLADQQTMEKLSYYCITGRSKKQKQWNQFNEELQVVLELKVNKQYFSFVILAYFILFLAPSHSTLSSIRFIYTILVQLHWLPLTSQLYLNMHFLYEALKHKILIPSDPYSMPVYSLILS